jgi:tetratricopeptide (TPR) repeat protein
VRVPGFEIIRKFLGNTNLKQGADVGPLILKPLDRSAAGLISWNSLSAPASARKELVKAREDAQDGKLDSAKKRLEKAIQQFPAYATAWYELGKLHEQQKESQSAASAYQRAAESDEKYLSPRIQLALMSAQAAQWPDAEARSGAILQLAPSGLPGMYLVHAMSSFNQQKFEAAETSARKGLEEDHANQFPRLAHLLGAVLEKKGDRAGAAVAFATYLQKAPQASDANAVRARIAALKQ